MYKEKLDSESFTEYAFSARRERKGPNHYEIVRCNNCGLVRSNRIITGDKTTLLYEKSHCLYQVESEFAANTYFTLFKNAVSQFNKKNLKILEIGSGNGTFLKKILEAGYNDIAGIEPSKESIDVADKCIQAKIVQDVFK